MNGNPGRDIRKDGGAVNELAGMRHRLANGAIRIVARKWIASTVSLAICGWRHRRAQIICQRGDACQRRNLCDPVVDMGLDYESLDTKRQEGEK